MTFRNGNGDRALMEPHSHPDKARTSGTNAPKQQQVPHRRRWLKIFAGAILIVGAIALYARWKPVSDNAGHPTVSAVTISTATATSGDIGVYVKALGTVIPLKTVSLTARVAGQIAKVEYQEGQVVHVGDPLVEIDPAPFQAAVTQA